MSEPVDAITTTSGIDSARAVSAAISTIADVVEPSGTPRKPGRRLAAQLDPHDLPGPAGPSTRRTSTVTGAVVP